MERAESSHSRPITPAVPATSARRATSQDRLHRQPQKRQRRHLLLRRQRPRLLRLQRPRPTAAATATPTAATTPGAGGPPAIPHELAGREACLACHGEGGLKPVPADHDGRTNDTCQTCHQPAAAAAAIRSAPTEAAGSRRCADASGCRRPRQRSRILSRARRTSAAPVTRPVASSRSLRATNRLRTRNA